jgi:hypothetical protein
MKVFITSRAMKLVGVILLAGFTMAMSGRPKGVVSNKPLNVDWVASDPSAYKGTFKIKGVVSSVSSAKSTFVLIDLREYSECRIVTCASKFVRVGYRGKLPRVTDKLVVTGEMVLHGKGYLFEAKEVQSL